MRRSDSIKNGKNWLEKWEGLTWKSGREWPEKNREVWIEKWEGPTEKMGKADLKVEKNWLKKWERLTLNMEGLSQNKKVHNQNIVSVETRSHWHFTVIVHITGVSYVFTVYLTWSIEKNPREEWSLVCWGKTFDV